MLKFIVPAIAALSLTTVSTSAAAETTSVSIRVDDLNLDSAAGMRTLNSRIEQASSHICGKAEARNVRSTSAVQKCRDEVASSFATELARIQQKREPQLALLSIPAPRK